MKCQTFVAPALFASLAACNGENSQPTPITMPRIDVPPVVSAGVDISADEFAIVQLAGSASDVDGEFSIEWRQITGPVVELESTDQLSTSFQTPFVRRDTTFTFRLTADDGVNDPVSDDINIRVEDAGVSVSRINPIGESYIDPELHPIRDEIVFQRNQQVWVGAFDPSTGRFVSDTGMDHLIADTIDLTRSRNGPEYGWDSSGVAVYFNSDGSDGSAQFSRAIELGVGSYSVGQLTPNGNDRVNQLPSQDPGSISTFLAYGRAATVPGVPGANGFISYLNERSPGNDIDVTPLRPGFAGFRWLRGSPIFATTVADPGPEEGQIKLVNAETGEQRVVTDDPGVKFDPFPWFAPEFENAIAVQARVNETDIAIYVDRGGAFFERVSLLTPPEETDLQFVQSAEPFVSQENISYISLTLKDNPGSVFTDVDDSEIWLYGISDGSDRFTLNCGDGAPNTVRHEAETRSGTSQILIYYNEILPSGAFDLVLCETGLEP
ncbi:MAG: hypothetical protein AAFV59_09890 [Pseudomonadota bacterium]